MEFLPHYLITLGTMGGIFILFQVMSSSLNSIIDYLRRVEFLLNKELEFREEEYEVRRVLLKAKN